MVNARLAGSRELFLLDTGATDTVIGRGAAERLGLDDRSRPILSGLNGRYQLTRVVRVESLALGGFSFADFDAMIIDLGPIRAAIGADIAGVIGCNVLALQPFELDFASDRLRLGPFPSTVRAGEGLAASVPLREIGGGYFVEAALGGGTLLFLIDSGAVPTTVSREVDLGDSVLSSSVDRVRNTQASGVELEKAESAVLASLRLGHVERRRFPVDRGDENLLGADFFEGLVLRIEPGAGRALVRRPGGEGGP
jgi:predicted aspartyl protease